MRRPSPINAGIASIRALATEAPSRACQSEASNDLVISLKSAIHSSRSSPLKRQPIVFTARIARPNIFRSRAVRAGKPPSIGPVTSAPGRSGGLSPGR